MGVERVGGGRDVCMCETGVVRWGGEGAGLFLGI